MLLKKKKKKKKISNLNCNITMLRYNLDQFMHAARLRPEVQPLTCTFFTVKVPLSFTFHLLMAPLSHIMLEAHLTYM